MYYINISDIYFYIILTDFIHTSQNSYEVECAPTFFLDYYHPLFTDSEAEGQGG